MGHVQRRLVRMVMAVVRFPKLTLGLCAALLIVSAGAAWTHLPLTTNQDELLTPKLPFFRDYQKFIAAFPENESFIVILQPRDYAHPPPGKRWMDFADHVAAALQAMPNDVKRVDWRVKPDDIGAQGILFAPWDMVKKYGGAAGLAGRATALSDDPQMHGYFIEADETKRGTPAYDNQPILVLNVYANRDYSSLKDVTEPLKRMRAAVEAVGKNFPEFKKPVITGRPALEADEMATSDHDTTLAEALGLTLVFIALFLFLRNLWLAIVAELCLGVGIAWTFGWATLSVGRLNLLSLVFVIALTGIGMDYLIQILTRYRFEKKRYSRPQAVWARVFRYVSPPISTACFGAAGAFFASVFTNFSGAAELGIIAGGGLLLCLLAGYTMLPALLTLFPARVGRVHVSRRYRHREPHPHAGGWRLVPAGLWILVAIAGLIISLPPRFDPNLLNLQADGVESVREVRRLQTWYAVLIADDLPSLAKAWAAIQPAPGETTTFDTDRTESLVIAQQKQAWMEAHPSLLSKPPKLDIWALPASLREHLVSGPPGAPSHTYALYIYPKDNLWESDKLERFVSEVERRFAAYHQDPQHPVTLTGIAPQLYHSTLEIHKAFLDATLYALALIVLLVALDLRKLSQTLLAISVLALGLPMLLLAMAAWRGIPVWNGATLEQLTGIPGSWNFANFFGLPILIGAGHEYGVFLVHRYRESLYDPRRIWRTWDVSDRALLLCAIVTTSSFGFLVLARHHGLQSLGWVMAVGTACIYLSGLLVLRPILIWRLKHKHAYKEARQPVLSVQ